MEEDGEVGTEEEEEAVPIVMSDGAIGSLDGLIFVDLVEAKRESIMMNFTFKNKVLASPTR